MHFKKITFTEGEKKTQTRRSATCISYKTLVRNNKHVFKILSDHKCLLKDQNDYISLHLSGESQNRSVLCVLCKLL